MTIPASQIAKIIPGVLAAGGAAVDLNGLIVTQSTYPPIGSLVSFSASSDVADYFGESSLEYSLAEIYFNGYTNGTATPGLLYFAQYPESAVAAYLRGAPLALTLAQLQELPAGTLTLAVDGASVTSESINLATATSFSAAAALITTAFGAALTATWDSVQEAFVLTTPTTGSAATLGYPTGTLATSLGLTQAMAASLSQGAAAATPSAFMDSIVKLSQNWGMFTTTWEPELADKLAFSAWTSNQSDGYAYAGYDSDPNAAETGSTETWGYAVKTAAYEGTIPIYGDVTHAVFALAWAASLDFTRLNGRATLAFKAQAGLVASVTDGTVATNLIANGYNFYGAYATKNTSSTQFYPGSISGKFLWADSYMNQIWMNATMQNALVALEQSIGSLPYNTAGYALVEAALADPLTSALNFGAIRTGTTLSATQIQQIINAIGSDVSQSIIAKGYYLQIVAATAAIRSARTSPSMTLYYADGGSIQALALASNEVQ